MTLFGAPSPMEPSDVAVAAGYHDQPQLTRSLRHLIGHTPAEVARGGVFLDV